MKTASASSARVRLLEVDPDLGTWLTPDEFAEARKLTVPVVTVSRHEPAVDRLGQEQTFGALVLEGMVLRQLRIADQMGMRLLGPGDIVALGEAPVPMVVVEASLDAAAETRLALLGREMLFAASRWPKLLAGLAFRNAQQADRLAAQLVICQLPRVDQRLLSLLWLLSESWWRVTSAGTALPLKLTHEALGALIGARRPTVTLALRELTERGAIVRQTEGWLLLAPPAEPTDRSERPQAPGLIGEQPSSWEPHENADEVAARTVAANAVAYDALAETIERLREQHAYNRDRFDERMRAYSTVRERCRVNRTRIASERLTRRRRRSPST